ncbi:MAG TPA: diguanylate cyclase [Tepidisphaeraceae bacterium]|nr:diguanylate cyclase [Tepidisphaeraceae bacterium]
MPQKILVIDDSSMIHALLTARLKDEPVQVTFANDGPSGLTSAGTLLPDLILLDVDMPGMDGFEVCRRLKADQQTRDIPVIFLTGASETDEKIKGLDLGATDYITKPFDMAELRARVRATLRTSYLLHLLSKKAMIDGLTGLWNRSYFDQRLTAELSLARRSNKPLSCIMCDIDHFKQVNDNYGHPGGDQILRDVAHLLVEACRIEDVVCRYGGEEFAIIGPNTHSQGAAELAERLRAGIFETEFHHQGASIRITCSFGIADAQCTQHIVQSADEALYRAKRCGRNRVEVQKAEPASNRPAA